jgi:RNA polymerase sigma factor (sigma-70 family)
MTNIHTISPVEETDASLVAESLNGSREAFGQIVGRYQTLICSLAYSATGSFSQSQDLAQETFVTAWKQLSGLREPGKLRSWLCGILKNRIYKNYRSQGHQPVHAAEPLEMAGEMASSELPPSDQTISKEEEAILWRSLEKIPELYREPLVLYYREHQSIETVAANLELSEDAVKQRLSRGRKLLQEQVLSFIEGALTRTNPGKMFTLGVLAALPAFTSTSKAAALGAAAFKGGAAAKGVGAMGVLSGIFSPLIVLFGNYSSYRMSMDEAQTDIERGYIKRAFLTSLYVTLGFSAVCAVLLFFALRNSHEPYLFWGLLSSQAIIIYFLTLLALSFIAIPQRREYLAEILAREHGGKFPESAYEYRSRLTLFGLPLIHIRIGDRFDVLRGPIKAWIAIGSSYAVGVIFASGNVAVAPISFGGVAIGLLPFGAVALGAFPIGAIAIGAWAFGGAALGWQICCGCGLAWNAAIGGIVMAHNFAMGSAAYAAQANTQLATQFFNQSLFFQIGESLSNHSIWVMLISALPITVQARIVARARRRREQGA